MEKTLPSPFVERAQLRAWMLQVLLRWHASRSSNQRRDENDTQQVCAYPVSFASIRCEVSVDHVSNHFLFARPPIVTGGPCLEAHG